MIILNGCTKTVVKTVKVNDFCQGRYESCWLEKKDFENIREMKKNPNFLVTINKLIDNIAVNEKEFEICIVNDNKGKSE